MVVAPSLAEGFGSVHTETVAMGKPLLTTDIGPLPEVVGGVTKMIPAGSSQAITE
jgi:glycosyltransferase involved in cell wall biosynthesis